MIPVIGTAVVNGVQWLDNLIQSVDYPTKEFVIINNNGREELNQKLDHLAKQKHKFIEKITVSHMPRNIGCSGAWNLIIKCYMFANYWIIVNHDIEFPSGYLAKMVEAINEPDIGTVHGDEGPSGSNTGGWSLFAIRDWVVENYGLFDENFYPGYGEDCDYEMRLALNPIKRKLSLNIPVKHGGSYDYGSTGSQTWRQDPQLKVKIDFARFLNEHEYLDYKWGKNWRLVSPYKTAFDIPNFPVTATPYSLYFARRKNLGF